MQNEPSVAILHYPDQLLKIVYTACRTCYSPKPSEELWNESVQEDKMVSLVSSILEAGHMSTIEHCTVVFALSNVSRACTHQLVRHRHVSFSQKSQRYVKEKGDFDYIVPEAIARSQFAPRFTSLMSEISAFYREMVGEGIAAEDARAVFPNAAASSLVMSTNMRELISIANLRLCTHAQLEIRILVKKMCDIVVGRDPWLAKWLVPKCVRNGYCDERTSCGRYPRREV